MWQVKKGKILFQYQCIFALYTCHTHLKEIMKRILKFTKLSRIYKIKMKEFFYRIGTLMQLIPQIVMRQVMNMQTKIVGGQ